MPVAFRSILCPIDFSENSREALRHGLALASVFGATVTTIYVDDPLLAQAAVIKLDRTIHDESLAELRRFTVEAVPGGASWVPPIEARVLTGAPHTSILTLAQEVRADLIVLGTQGLSGPRKLFFGSTTERVLRHTPVPVLVVPGGPGDFLGLTAAGPYFKPGVVLVPIERTPEAPAQVSTAREVAACLKAPLLFLHVVVPSRVLSSWRLRKEKSDESRVAEATGWLQGLARDAAGSSSDVLVASGFPADRIVRTAVERGAMLIVMGLRTNRESGAPQPGSIAYRVLTLCPTPLLALPPPPRV